MSTVPPSTPPGAPPPGYPPYDPKTQWRIYREQQKAAWRAQRDAFRAQRYAAKAGYYGGVYAPRVPSVVGPIILIGVGIIALLLVTGHIDASQFWSWYAQWWPLLLICAGLALLGEWALDLRRKVPVRRGGSFVGLLILLAIIGLSAAGWNHWWGPFRAQFGDNGDDFFNAFGRPERDNDQQILNAAIASNGSIEVQNPRGDVSITAGDGPNVEVQAHEVAYADSDSDAKKIFDAEAAHLTVSGNAVLIKSQSNTSGRLNLTVTVPKSARVTVNAGHGDVTAAGLGTGLNLSASHGDVHLSSIAGSVQVHFPNGRHDFTAHQVDGDITADGDINDLTLSEIKGKINQSGEILGDVHIENVIGPLHLHTSVTDLQVAQLPGDLTLNSDDLRVTEAKGQVRVTTHSKDVDLSQIYGDSYVEDRDGRVSLEPAGSYSIEAKNSKGDVELTLPPDASATVNAHTHNGDIVSDYPMPSMEGDNKSATFQIGSGSSRIVLSTDNGDLHIKKGSAFPAVPPKPTVEETPSAPQAPKAPHLKTPKPLPPQPVTQ
jgi:DUF4097 and DUF4098 domain-containing protein YvlB